MTQARESAPFLAACRGEEPAHRPVWFMRQAGRALPEYRKIREGTGMLEACRTPDLVTEITLQPVRRYGVDAAVLFSDIVVPLAAAGIDVDIKPGVGPVVGSPVRTATDVATLPRLEAPALEPVAQACRQLVGALGDVPLLGFAGAPFTLASYLVEGGPSREHLRTKELMYAAPDVWHALMTYLADVASTFLRAQIDAGAAAIQLFDSWAGTLSERDYRRFVLPHSQRVLASVADVPRVHFGVGTGELLAAMGEALGDGVGVVGVDWRVPLDVAATRVGTTRGLQGNLDPALVATAPWDEVAAATRDVLRRGAAARGHVMNLGHGVLPETDPDVLTRVVELVHETPVGTSPVLD
ncbi:MAG TPA: uroporphyrinogen decarboxylase [Mycobacteriales bacterium]|nr:uroporphyrinogen decarboxylase [Mycobacteriales bacterium]